MNLHHLAVFQAIAESGSISAAARRLHISQPALSRELQAFETRLGLQLFERMPRGMRLTEAGWELQRHASRLFALERSAEEAMRDLAAARRGRLAIGASNTIGTYVLPPMLACFRRLHPDVSVSLFVGNTEQVSHGVADLHFTLGFIEGPLHMEGLEASTFQDDEIVPVVAAGHPLLSVRRLTAGRLDGQPMLMREPGSGTRELIADLLRAHRIDDSDVMEFGNTEALKQAAVHGGGIAWLPRISMRRELDQGMLRALPLPALYIHRPLQILQRRGSRTAPVVHRFIELLTHSAPAD